MSSVSPLLRYCAFAVLLALAAPALAAAPPVALREVASGFSAPLEITHAGDGSGRLFVVEKGGRVMIVKGGAVLATPFLDVGPLVSTSGERGLLGLAFHPQFGVNRKFYVYYTRAADGAIVVSEFLASVADPDRADAASERVVIIIPHPDFDNHNGGRIAFGPGGYLYIGVGDGGSGGDPNNNAQSPASLLGKLLRIDVNTSPGYAVPASNPFVGQAGYAPEIWAYGLRNPWRFSFDRLTADLYIGDVGQASWEEINFEPAGQPGGRNYGWRVFEGTHCYNPSSGCSLPAAVPPVLEYGHDAQGGNSVTGGYVYRGSSNAPLRGFYVYGDFVSNRVWAAKFDGAWSTSVLIEPPGAISGISSFGEDEAGELYVASFLDGRIYALEAVPDTQAPSVPTGLTVTATSTSASQFNLAWNASTDDAGVTQYRIYRTTYNNCVLSPGTICLLWYSATVLAATVSGAPPPTSYTDSGLLPWTQYDYNVQACDTAGNCSALSATGTLTYGLLEPGFNLVGNALDITLEVATVFGNQDAPVAGITENIVSTWKWNALNGRWAFYSPLLTVADIASFAASKGYEVLSVINPGEGYWVNALTQMTLPAMTGPPFNWNGFSFGALPAGFNLIATASYMTPSQFNNAVSLTPPSPGAISTANFVSLWAWDPVAGNWYFYSPLLESTGGLAAVKSYADGKFFLHFQDHSKTLGTGVGFWVNRP